MSAIAQLVWSEGIVSGADPSFASVTALFHFDGANADTGPWADSSNTGTSIARQAAGPALTTTSPKFGTACLSFNGTSWARIAAATAHEPGNGDFTLEFWVKTANPASTYNYYDNANAANVNFSIYQSGGIFHFFAAGADRITGGSVATSTWQNVCICRVSGTTKMFADGTQIGSNYTDGNNYTAGSLNVGGSNTGTFPFVGQVDEFRFTKGVGRYSSNYTPASAAFPNF